MQLCHRNPNGHKLKKHICLLEPSTHVPALPVWLVFSCVNSCLDWRSCQSRRAAVLQPSGGNGRFKLEAIHRIPALQYKSVPNSFLCVKLKLCFPWSPNAGGHKKYLVNGAKKMSGDLNMFVFIRAVHHINELRCHAWWHVVCHAPGPMHLPGNAGPHGLYRNLMHAF